MYRFEQYQTTADFQSACDDPQWTESEIRSMWDSGIGKRGVPSFARFVGCFFGFDMYRDNDRGVYISRGGFIMFYREDRN